MKPRPPAPSRTKFQVRIERADDAAYTARIDRLKDAQHVDADDAVDSGIMNLLGDMLVEVVREEGAASGDDRE